MKRSSETRRLEKAFENRLANFIPERRRDDVLFCRFSAIRSESGRWVEAEMKEEVSELRDVLLHAHSLHVPRAIGSFWLLLTTSAYHVRRLHDDIWRM